MVELRDSKLWHCSRDPQNVIKNGFCPAFSSSIDGRMYFTDVSQPVSNIVVEVFVILRLYQGNEYGEGNPGAEELLSKGFDGICEKAGKGDGYVQIGETEIIIFPEGLRKLSRPQTYYYGEEDV